MRKPNYNDLGFGRSMGPNLLALVEKQLKTDLSHYIKTDGMLQFDWSESCINGACTNYLDSSIDRFSDIYLYQGEKLRFYGWMEFIHEENFFLVYWEFLDFYQGQKMIPLKDKPGIPQHVWTQIPSNLRSQYKGIKIQ